MLRGRYYYYSIDDTDNYICKNIDKKEGDYIYSVRQNRPAGKQVRCEYYADRDCFGAQGTLTRTGPWVQPDLLDEARPFLVQGTWYDSILSVQCFWVQLDEPDSPQEPIIKARGISDSSALADEAPAEKDLEVRQSHDDHILVSPERALSTEAHVC